MHSWIPKAGASAGRLIVSTGGKSIGFVAQKGAGGVAGRALQLLPGVGQALAVGFIAYDVYRFTKWILKK